MTTEQLTHRQIDAWAAELLGWTKTEKGFWFKPGKEPSWNYDALDPPSYTTDANDDAKVRKAVLEMKDQVQSLRIANAVYTLWQRRAERQEHGRLFAGKVIRYAETGDWAVAAYAVSKGLDPVEVLKELRDG